MKVTISPLLPLISLTVEPIAVEHALTSNIYSILVSLICVKVFSPLFSPTIFFNR